MPEMIRIGLIVHRAFFIADEEEQAGSGQEEQEPAQAQPTEDAAQEEEPSEAPGSDESASEEQAPPPDMDVFDILRMSLGLFAQEAWVSMGLQTRPGASDTKRDLRCARIAIDIVEVVGEKLGDEAEEEECRTIDQILTDLRVNFVRVSSQSEEQS